ncbi:hypothetical protein EDD15DRAFT_2364779 [Pisolithus albus]|nr:hypothetical protein EDD15DRAFT_2364779 [Pisolithus albus]
MDDEKIVNVPDPPSSHSELPTIQIECPTRTHSATRTSFVLPVSEPTPKEPDKLEGGDWHVDAAGSGHPDSDGVRKSVLTGNRDQHTECKAKQPNHSPAPSTPLPKHTRDVSRPYRVPHRCGRLKSSTESVSNTRARQNIYLMHVAPTRPPLPLSAPEKRIAFTVGGPQQSADVESTTTKLELRTISTHMSEMGGILPRSKMRPRDPNGEEKGGRFDGTVSSEFADSHRIENSMLADVRNQQGEQGTRRQNGLPASPKLPLNALTHHPGTLSDPRRRGRIKTDLRNFCDVETRGFTYLCLTIVTSPPCEIAKRLWNVANTYWLQGVPPGRMYNVDKPSLFDAVPLRQWYS